MIARARLDWQNGKPHGSSSNCRDLNGVSAAVRRGGLRGLYSKGASPWMAVRLGAE
jgi:hypothetical protein